MSSEEANNGQIQVKHYHNMNSIKTLQTIHSHILRAIQKISKKVQE